MSSRNVTARGGACSAGQVERTLADRFEDESGHAAAADHEPARSDEVSVGVILGFPDEIAGELQRWRASFGDPLAEVVPAHITLVTTTPTQDWEATRRHVGSFACMIRNLTGDRLPDWMDLVREDNLPALHSFVNGLRHDLAAVTAGLTLPWSNGPTEGTVNKIKLLKRMAFGRAGFPLLRKMILHAT